MAVRAIEAPNEVSKCRKCGRQVAGGKYCIINGEENFLLQDMKVEDCPYCGNQQEFPRTFLTIESAVRMVENINRFGVDIRRQKFMYVGNMNLRVQSL